MIKTVKLYDEHINALLKMLDTEARKYDACKYGLPLQENLKGIVYRWLHDASQQVNAASE